VRLCQTAIEIVNAIFANRGVEFQKRGQLVIGAPFWLLRQPSCDQTHRELVYRPFQLHNRSQSFMRTHSEPLSIAMRVSNPDCSPIGINR
jgi:hypothetical protein